MKEQRDVALACAILSAAISVSVFLTVFRDRSSEFGEIEQSIKAHRELLEANEEALAANQRVLAEIQQALEARNDSQP